MKRTFCRSVGRNTNNYLNWNLQSLGIDPLHYHWLNDQMLTITTLEIFWMIWCSYRQFTIQRTRWKIAFFPHHFFFPFLCILIFPGEYNAVIFMIFISVSRFSSAPFLQFSGKKKQFFFLSHCMCAVCSSCVRLHFIC